MAEQAEVKEKSTNCAGCNKPLKKAKKYYRNGKYYCKNKCFKDSQKKEQKEQKEQKEPKK